MSLLTRLKNLSLTNIDLDDAIELSTQAESLRDGYKRHQVPSPEPLDEAIRALDRYIGDRTRDVMEMRLRELEQADAADLTASERRDKRKVERAALEAKLGKTPQPA